MMSRLFRHLREGIKNVIRNGWMSFASMSAVIVTLAVLGFSLILTFNVAQMSTDVTSQLEFSAFLNVNATQQTGSAIAAQIKALPGVESVQVISKNEGLAQMKKELGSEMGDVLNAFKQNPLPIQLVVKRLIRIKLTGLPGRLAKSRELRRCAILISWLRRFSAPWLSSETSVSCLSSRCSSRRCS
ncbi:hypothetical protein GCM10025858_23450 [Alicyclobacillus sacchari]|uniref:permease-like cell division protein FtsX n=1 Tax=Alicyclobacillus sacchari TaxID=392010 RepID=UPI0023EA3732|nr:permease-like cell division protein FtsX [Alicyclobacillus sacchari]GMA57842.1 hypothetical protein GCM10025858_23450 [Alicyclobacillus sacchari]